MLCQTGAILIDEECQHFTEIVNGMFFIVNIVLMPTSSLTLLQLQTETIKELSNHLIRTWGNYWEVQNVDISFDFSSQVDTIFGKIYL